MKNIDIEEYKKAVDTVDLMRDEFIRIKVLCNTETSSIQYAKSIISEIEGLCERAITKIERNVSVIDDLERHAEALNKIKRALVEFMID